MIVYIDKKRAVLPESFSMEYVQENRLFGDSEGYSLSVDLPLRGCPENIAIFGHLNHKEIAYQSKTYSCMIVHGNVCKTGIAVPVGVSETSISIQFLEGRSSVKYSSPLEENIIRDINLPYPSNVTPAQHAFANVRDIDDGQYYLNLPWINNYTGNIQNEVGDTLTTDQATGRQYYPLTYSTVPAHQIYLIKLTELILAAVGYTSDLSEWMNTKWRYLLVWNAVPSAWGERNFNAPLPRWTVLEYLQHIENLTGLDFDINETNKHVTARFTIDATSTKVVINDVVQEFEEEIDEEAEPKYREALELKYTDRDDDDWKLESCSYNIPVVERMVGIDDTKTWSLLYNHNQGYNSWYNVFKNALYRLVTINNSIIDFHPCMAKNVGGGSYQWLTIPMLFNSFGCTSTDKDKEATEVSIIPVHVADCTVDESTYLANESNHCVLLDLGEYEDVHYVSSHIAPLPTSAEEAGKQKNDAEYVAIEGERVNDEFFKTILVSFWTKNCAHTYDESGTPICLKQTFNQTGVRDVICMPEKGMMALRSSGTALSDAVGDLDMTLSLRKGTLAAKRARQIESRVKYTFRWLSKDVPDIMSTFIIHGRRYLCAKIKTTWTIKGRSEEIEGEFYELL